MTAAHILDACARLSGPWVLAMTPAPGGIQLLSHRIVRHAQRLRIRTVTLPVPVRHGPTELGVDVLRYAPRNRAVCLLNLKGVIEGLKFRPRALLSFHIVTIPAAGTRGNALSISTVVYVPGRGGTRLAAPYPLRSAPLACGSSRQPAYGRDMALRLGAAPQRRDVIPQGVDLLAHRLDERAERPTLITVVRLEDRYREHDIVMRALPLLRRRCAGYWSGRALCVPSSNASPPKMESRTPFCSPAD